MSIDKTVVAKAISALASVEGALMQPEALAEDALCLTLAFPEENDYKSAVVNTTKALRDLVGNRVSTNELAGIFQGWESYHYQPKIGQSIAANMRIVFRRNEGRIYVLGFGHRYVPEDVYRRLSALRQARR